MGFTLRAIETECKFCQAVSVEAVTRVVSTAAIEAVLAEHGPPGTRARKLTPALTVLLVIAMSLYTQLSLAHILRRLAAGLRYIWPGADNVLAGDAAISYRRHQLGVRPMRALFQRVCQPLAGPQTRGAFLGDLRLMAIDGTVEEVPDTPANAAAFGRHHSSRGAAAFPQVLAEYLLECGTHAIVDATFWPCHAGEHGAARRLLRAVQPGMLLMWDRGLYSYPLFAGVVRRGSHVLARLPAGVKPHLVVSLQDGSYLAQIYPSGRRRHTPEEALPVRVVEYTIGAPALPGYGAQHRLITTLLEAVRYPALELAAVYHERWEIETAIDEQDTHQRLASRPLRSLTPRGVIQELYGLLIAHYAVRALMHEAALQADADPDRISFVGALRLLQDAVPEFQMTAPEELPQLHARLLGDMTRTLLPPRRPRRNPRVVKRKLSNYKRKRPEHAHLPQPRGPYREALRLI
jgi:hypothetical protein